MLSIQKAQGKRSDLETSSGQVEEVKTKAEIAKEQGYSKDQVSEYQRLAQNPEIVQKVIDDAARSRAYIPSECRHPSIQAFLSITGINISNHLYIP